jgi:hypothetical protein
MGVSGQNFLNLLFGGVNQGINQYRQQQGQKVDLALTIQQMLERQKAGAQQQQNWETSFGAEQNWRKAQTERNEKLDAQNEGWRIAESLRREAADAKANADKVAQLKFWTDMAAKNPQLAPLADMMIGDAPAGAMTAMMQQQGGKPAKTPVQERFDWYFPQFLKMKKADDEPYSEEEARALAWQRALEDMRGAPQQKSPTDMASEMGLTGADIFEAVNDPDFPAVYQAWLKGQNAGVR